MSLAPDRDKYRNASYAPAMLGISPYMKREELLIANKYGIWPAVTPQTQRIFAKGHENEAVARPIAEALVGHPLPPKRFTRGNLGATLDGYYLDAASLDSVNWECKTLNADIRAAFEIGISRQSFDTSVSTNEYPEFFDEVKLPKYLCAQIEQQLICSEADKCLLTAYADGESVHCWYYPDATMRQRIIDGWAQFERDLAAMPEVMPVKAIEGQLMPVVRALPAIPELKFGLVKGATVDLEKLKTDVVAFVNTINQKLVTDQDFADADSDIEGLENRCMLVKSVIEATPEYKALTFVFDTMNKALISIKKQRAERKEARKTELWTATQKLYREHVDAIKLTEYIANNGVNFAPVIKGMSSIASMQNALSAALLKAQSEATAQAVKIRANLALIAAAGNDLLFPNLRDLVAKTPEDLANHIAVVLAKAAAKAEADKLKALEIAASEVVNAALGLPSAIDAPESEQCSGLCEPDCPALPTANARIMAIVKLNITQINERLKVVTVATTQLVALGFPGVEGPRKGLMVWPESDYPCITAAIKANI